MSRRSSASVLGGKGPPSGVRSAIETLGGLAQRRLEAPDAEAGQAALHSVHDPRALADQALALAVRPLGILILERRNRRHAAMVRFAAQPAEKRALEQARCRAGRSSPAGAHATRRRSSDG